jgi:hypothetical protein
LFYLFQCSLYRYDFPFAVFHNGIHRFSRVDQAERSRPPWAVMCSYISFAKRAKTLKFSGIQTRNFKHISPSNISCGLRLVINSSRPTDAAVGATLTISCRDGWCDVWSTTSWWNSHATRRARRRGWAERKKSTFVVSTIMNRPWWTYNTPCLLLTTLYNGFVNFESFPSRV